MTKMEYGETSLRIPCFMPEKWIFVDSSGRPMVNYMTPNSDEHFHGLDVPAKCYFQEGAVWTKFNFVWVKLCLVSAPCSTGYEMYVLYQ